MSQTTPLACGPFTSATICARSAAAAEKSQNATGYNGPSRNARMASRS